MNTPTTKVELITALEGGRGDWNSVLAAIDEHAFVEPGVEGAWSVQQIVAHVAGYEAWAAACLTDQHDLSVGPSLRSTPIGSGSWMSIASTTRISRRA